MYDQATIRGVMAGNMEAFSKMYKECSTPVYNRAFSILGDHVNAREAVRKTFLDIYHFSPQLADPSLFDEWVYRLVGYHCGMIAQTSDREKLGLESVWDEIEEIVDIRRPPLPVVDAHFNQPPAPLVDSSTKAQQPSQPESAAAKPASKANEDLSRKPEAKPRIAVDIPEIIPETRAEFKAKQKSKSEPEQRSELRSELSEVKPDEKSEARLETDAASRAPSDQRDAWAPILFPTEEGDLNLRMPSESASNRTFDPPRTAMAESSNVYEASAAHENLQTESTIESAPEPEPASVMETASAMETASESPQYITPPAYPFGPPERSAPMAVKDLPKRVRKKTPELSRIVVETAQAPRRPNISYERVPYDYQPYDEEAQAAYENIELTDSPQGTYERVPYDRAWSYKAPHASYEKIPLDLKPEKDTSGSNKSEDSDDSKADQKPEINMIFKNKKAKIGGAGMGFLIGAGAIIVIGLIVLKYLQIW